ncbi:MAG: hypothetical protein ASARMPRED_006854 [Alectoria sarmentosa]|nr:MAG: hypothetical protein ASARMPRED_006854 [Alectoria sarmentosa]
MSTKSLSALPDPKEQAIFTSIGSPLFNAKRKRSHDEDHDFEAVVVNSEKRKQSKKSKEPKSVDDSNFDMDRGLNLAIAKLDNRLLADYLAKRTTRFLPDLSLVELEDRRISETAFVDITSWKKPRTLQNMPSFLEQYNPKAGGDMTLPSASRQPGNPHTLVITSAGLRAANITRALRIFQTKDAMVAKLFAKHIKLREAIGYVKRTRIGIGVGTPSRIIDLLDSGSLSSSSLERVVVDCSHIDQKKRGIFDMRETQEPLMELLNRSELKSRYGNGSGKTVIGLKAFEPPGCVSKCWDNSKYVSTCVKANETQCLCEDAEFQSVVLQCLYSQCQTTQFGFALHQTLSACSGSGMDTLDALPPLIRHQGLRKRGSPSIGYASGHLSGSTIHSVARRSVSASAYVSARPTRSVGHLPGPTRDLPMSLSVALPATTSGANVNSTSVLAPLANTS